MDDSTISDEPDLPLPQRTGSHVTENEARKIFEDLLSTDWIVRTIAQPDYGLDLEVELAPKTGVSGRKALIQLKGTHAIEWNAEKSFVFSGVKASTTNYWLQQDLPVFLVLVDISARRAFVISAKSYIRENFATVLERKALSYRFLECRELLDKSDYAFLSSFFTEKDLARRDAAIGELPRFQEALFEFHRPNYRRDAHMEVESEERQLALFDLVVDCRRLSRLLGLRFLSHRDEKFFEAWQTQKPYPHPMTEGELTGWLDRIDKAHVRLVRRAKYLVLQAEKAYWDHRAHSMVERIARLSDWSAEQATLAAWRGGPGGRWGSAF